MTHKIVLSIATLILLLAPAHSAQTPGKASPSEAVRSELARMIEDDQKYRQEKDDLSDKLAGPNREKAEKRLQEMAKLQDALDKRNRQRLDEIVKEYGWPTIGAFGKEASLAAFLIVQHAELEYQKRYFPLIKEAAARNEARPSDLAMLEDRILIREGKKQIYGSQVRFNDKTKIMELFPVEDEQNVDARRAAVGLEPLAQYLKGFGIDYVPPKKN